MGRSYAGVRVIKLDGQFMIMPTISRSRKPSLDLTVACLKDAIVMVEGRPEEASEAEIVDALMFAHQASQPIINFIERLKRSRPDQTPIYAKGASSRCCKTRERHL